MLNEKLIELRDYVLESNPYFQEGIIGVYKDDRGIADEKGYVFPSDSRGDYFYLRLPVDIPIVVDNRFAVSDCKTPLGAVAPIVLVAIVRNADPDKLLQNLLNTIMAFPAEGKGVSSVSPHKESVVASEMSGLNADVIRKALQTIPDEFTIVSITFTLSVGIKYSNCFVDICKSC